MATFKDFERAMKEAIDEITKPENMRKYGEQAASMIKLRTRLGDGVDMPGGTKKKLKPLSKSYIEQRKSGKLSAETSPGKSNLTRTGQLLDSMGVTSVSSDVVTVGPKGSRDDGLTNVEVAKHVTENGRAFNNLSKTELKRIYDVIEKDIEAVIEKKLARMK